MMKTICAWCGALLCSAPGKGVSHGICKPCKDKLLRGEVMKQYYVARRGIMCCQSDGTERKIAKGPVRFVVLMVSGDYLGTISVNDLGGFAFSQSGELKFTQNKDEVRLFLKE